MFPSVEMKEKNALIFNLFLFNEEGKIKLCVKFGGKRIYYLPKKENKT
jgi:hypothetical protein